MNDRQACRPALTNESRHCCDNRGGELRAYRHCCYFGVEMTPVTVDRDDCSALWVDTKQRVKSTTHSAAVDDHGRRGILIEHLVLYLPKGDEPTIPVRSGAPLRPEPPVHDPAIGCPPATCPPPTARWDGLNGRVGRHRQGYPLMMVPQDERGIPPQRWPDDRPHLDSVCEWLASVRHAQRPAPGPKRVLWVKAWGVTAEFTVDGSDGLMGREVAGGSGIPGDVVTGWRLPGRHRWSGEVPRGGFVVACCPHSSGRSPG